MNPVHPAAADMTATSAMISAQPIPLAPVPDCPSKRLAALAMPRS